jgi:23S rRNA (adenine2503-C2)-methyltransferase
MTKSLIYDFSHQDFSEFFQLSGEPNFRADQVWKGLYQQLWQTPDQFSNIPLSLRDSINEHFSFSGLSRRKDLFSKDGDTQKILFSLADGKEIETVLMRYKDRNTLCISTQSGCALGCVFCATGQMGFGRNLTSGEIVEQIIFFSHLLKIENQVVTNIVFMGMGEPMLNLEATLKAIDCINDKDGIGMGERRFTISTVGIPPQIRAFASQMRQINLAISLHAANDELRSSLLPINKKYKLSELIDACKEYLSITNRRISFEWALIQDINDKEVHARELVSLIKGLLCHVNIILLNPTRKFTGSPTTSQRAQEFRSVLVNSRIPCTIRLRRGIDIQAGCGQLAAQNNQQKSA